MDFPPPPLFARAKRARSAPPRRAAPRPSTCARWEGDFDDMDLLSKSPSPATGAGAAPDARARGPAPASGGPLVIRRQHPSPASVASIRRQHPSAGIRHRHPSAASVPAIPSISPLRCAPQDNQNGPLTSGHGGKLDALRCALYIYIYNKKNYNNNDNIYNNIDVAHR